MIISNTIQAIESVRLYIHDFIILNTVAFVH